MDKKLKKYIAYPKSSKEKKAGSFFELALKHAVSGGRKNRNLSKEIDRVLYGA
ncbi:MAG: hypothetical protein Q8P86_02995 [bacterium]|nr:hypothetical protein [bacterium]